MENVLTHEFKAKKWPQYFAAIAASLGAFQLGLVFGLVLVLDVQISWASPGLPDMVDRGDFGGLSSDETSWIASLASLACFCATYPSGYLIQKFGRQPVMISTSVPFMIGWLMIAFAAKVEMVYIGRFVTGFCSGIFSIATPVFIAETSEASIRGALGSCFQLLLVTGILFSYIIGAFVSWRWLAIICVVPTLVCELMLFFTPDSPRYLISIGDIHGAKESLMWFRGASCFEQVKANVQSNAKATYKDLLQPSIRKPILLVVLLLLLQQASGIDVITLFTVDIFKNAGSTIDPNLSSIIIGIVQVIFNLIAVFITDRVGRRVLLLSTNFILAISLFTLGLFFFIQDESLEVKAGWLPLASLIVFEACFSLGVGPLAWLFVGEILPNHVIGIASSLSTSILWLLSFIITRMFVPISEVFGQETCFWFFGAATIIGTVYMYFFMPETKGKTLDEVQALVA